MSEPRTNAEESSTADANVLTVFPREDISQNYTPGTVIADMPIDFDADRYNMNHNRRGKCVVFNHDVFSESAKARPRAGSTADVKRLFRTFKRLGFEVEIYVNFTYTAIINMLIKLSQEDHRDADCFCLIILTHGTIRDQIWGFDKMYTAHEVWKHFTADKCPSLAGKPKLCFVQACHGNEYDDGVILQAIKKHCSATDNSSESYTIPTHADFLLCRSSVQGFVSWRSTQTGSWFIETLCDVLDDYAEKLDFLKILTITARKIAMERVSDRHAASGKKQVPSFVSMLLRDLYLTPKES